MEQVLEFSTSFETKNYIISNIQHLGQKISDQFNKKDA
jgi:uncharacterized protein YeeX (DUF496 family)